MFETQEMISLLRKAGDSNEHIATAAAKEIAVALEEPLREGVLSGDILFDIFERKVFMPGQSIEYALDFIAPGTEKEYVAYTIPSHGRLPEKHVEGSLVTVNTYDVGAAIDTRLKFIREARWDVVARMLSVLESMHIAKNNLDAWSILIGAAYDRNIMVFDADALQGQFTTRLVSLMKLGMARNAGGNSTSVGRQGVMTDLFLSLEAAEDMRSWGVDQVDEVTRREIFLSGDGHLSRVFQVNLHPLYEFGVGRVYNQLFLQSFGGSLAANDVELVIGLDLKNKDSFVNPVKEELQIHEDPTLHRQRRFGLYSWTEHSWAVLDNRRVIAGSL